MIYPPYNNFIFSTYFESRFKKESILFEREYFPICTTKAWTEPDEVESIKERIKLIDPNKKYFTVTELLNFPLPGNVLNFGAGHGDIPIPYLSDLPSLNPSPIQLRTEKIKFRGNLSGKRELLNSLDYVLCEWVSPCVYFEELNNTVFALCPQGCDYSSYRLYEAIASGCLPVYISDVHWLPFPEIINWDEFCILLGWNELDTMERILKLFNPRLMQAKAFEAQKYLNKEFTYNYIIKKLSA